jgi:Type III restriction enzyme, res subunit/Helicase conserved C-terminal domain
MSDSSELNISSISSTENTENTITTTSNDKYNYDTMKKDNSYPEPDDPDIQQKMYQKKEFYNNRIHERRTYKNYKDIKDHRDELCDPAHFKPHPYQNLLPNFINPDTPYKGLIIMHGLGSGKTFTGINIAERFIRQCQKYRTKIYVLLPGPILKEKWKKDILNSTGEKYMKYIDKSLIVSRDEKEKLQKNAMGLILQYYKFMSYKSFYKHVLGERIVDKKEDGQKVKNVYRKNEEGEFERDVSVDQIHSLNNTLLIVDEAHQITGNAYGDAVKKIIEKSMNLKVLLMTATPMKNLADDFVELVNFLRPKNHQMDREKIFSPNKNYLMEFKPGGEAYLRNMSMGYVSYVKGADNLTYAAKVEVGDIPAGLYFTRVTRCFMDEFQKKVYYDTIEEQNKEIDDIENEHQEEESKKDVLDRKSESISNFVFPGLSNDKKNLIGFYGREGINNIKNQLKENGSLLNKKISEMLYGHSNETELLSITNDGRLLTGKIFQLHNLKNFSSKFHQALGNINNLVWGKNGVKTAFIYSNLVKVGIELFQEILLQNGYLEYQEDEQNYQITPETVCYYCGVSHKDHNIVARTTEHELKNIPFHNFFPATFITVTGKAADESTENIPEEKMKIIDDVFNNINNKEGKHIKFILGSRVMNEGVSLKNVGEVHILDVYFNLGKVDQAIGRAIRYCSHWKVMNEQNVYPEVKVHKYVIGIDKGLSTEEDLYRKAEIKHILVKKVERIIKEVAIDCPLNYNGNISVNEIEKYKNCENEGEFKCPASCDYMNCEFKCYDVKLNSKYYDPDRKIYKKIKKENLDDSTFSQELARNEIDFVKSKIKDMYILDYSYKLDDIINKVKENYEDETKDIFDEFYVFKALDELIPITENDFNNFKDTITDKYHRQGYLIYRGKYYIFQPFDANETLPMYYRANVEKSIPSNLSIYSYLKMTNQLNQQMDIKLKSKLSELDTNIDTDIQSLYDFEKTMDYYDTRDEYKYVGIIDKEINRRKNKDISEINDVFKIREKRAKILEKKRATGLPSLKGAVCATAKEKEYLEKIAKAMGIDTKNKKTRQDLCGQIERQMLLLEKYGKTNVDSSGKKFDKNEKKITYIMIPSNHPLYQFPYNLEDRTTHTINEIKNKVKLNIKIDTKKIAKTSGTEKGFPSYVIIISNSEKVKDNNDIEMLTSVLKKYNAKETKKEKEWEILLE